MPTSSGLKKIQIWDSMCDLANYLKKNDFNVTILEKKNSF